MSRKCPINANNAEPTPVQKPSGFSPLRAKVLKFFDDVANVAGVVTDKQTFEAEYLKRFTTLAAGVSNIPTLTKYSKLESWFSYALGWRSAIWDFASVGRTEAGAISELLIQRAKVASNSVELMATYKSLPQIRGIYGNLRKALPNLPESQLQELIHDQVVAGQFPKLTNIYDSPTAQFTLKQRYLAHLSKLQQLGLSPDDIKTLDELAGEISGNLDAARMLVAKHGMDIKQLQNGGYFPLQATEEARKILAKANETAFGGSAAHFDTAAFLSRSRNSAIPAVLDLPEAAKLLKMSEFELALKMSEPGELAKHIRANFTEAEIEKAFENGTLFQLPALSDELFHWFSEGLDLPIKNLGEAIQLNPMQAIQDYNRNLANGVKNASFIQTALDTGAKEGWILDSIEHANLPNKQDYIKIGSNQAIADMVRSTGLRDYISEGYIHRTVADQLNALWQMNVSAERLGIFGKTLQSTLRLTGFLKKSFILSTGGLPYVKRVFLQDIVSLNAATGSKGLYKFPLGLADVARAYSTKALDHLSTEAFSKPIGGKSWSLRALYEHTFLTQASPYTSGVGENVQAGSWSKFLERLDPTYLEKFTRFQTYYHKTFGSPMTGIVGDFAKEIASAAGDGFNAAYEQLARANQFIDYASMWTTIRTLAEDPSLAQGRKEWKNISELMSYAREYHNIQEDAGTIGKAAGQFAVPFAAFAMNAPGSTLRHAMRNPWQYGRMMMLYTQAQNAGDGTNLTDAELAKWQKSSYNNFIGKTSDGEIYAINPGTVDFYLDSSIWMRENFLKGLRLAGVGAGTPKDALDSKINPGANIVKSLQDFGKKTYVTSAILNVFTDIDPRTGKPMNQAAGDDTLLNIRLNPKIRNLLLQFAPVLGGLDKKLPESIVGSPPVLDPVTGEQRQPGIQGIFGNIPDRAGNSRKSDVDFNDPNQRFAWLADNILGLTPTLFSPGANLISNYNDIQSLQKDLGQTKADLNAKLVQQPNRPDKDKLIEERKRILQLEYTVQYHLEAIKTLATEKKLPQPEVAKWYIQLRRGALNFDQEAELVNAENQALLRMKARTNQPVTSP
jgi:hypothetical protein